MVVAARRSAKQRHDLILARLGAERRVEAAELAVVLGVAVETVRRDLRVLEDRGALVRAHGGAVPVDALEDPRRPVADATSRCLAVAAGHLVPPGGSALLGGGPHCHALAQHLLEQPGSWEGLHVVTSSIDVAVLLSRRDDVVLHNLGGSIGPDQRQHGPWTLDELAPLRVDVAFLAPDGIDVDGGLTAVDARTGAVGAAMVAAADELVALADGPAVGRVAFRRYADARDVGTLVVDDTASEVDVGALADVGVAVERVRVP